MRKKIYNKYPKEKIAALSLEEFSGRVVVIMTKGETEKAVRFLLEQPILGIDTETRPSFRRGESHKVALLQVSSDDICFLFRLNMIGLPRPLIDLLEDERVPKVGLSLSDDIRSLRLRSDFKPGYLIDLQDIVGSIGIEDRSLQKLYANLIGKKISKRQQLSNWEADSLNEKQKRYAATDAWACIQLYKEITNLKRTGDYEIITSQ